MNEQGTRPEYSILKFDTHNKAEEGLNDAVKDGWRLVNYQAMGDSTAITHFILLERPARSEFPRLGR
jgi:hypothetical protein